MQLQKLLVVFCVAVMLQGCVTGYRKVHKPEQFPPADPIPRKLPISRYGNPTSYEVFGQTYHLLPTNVGYSERGVASWYGKKFHGRRASSGETYNMYAMTAAHKTLPIPVYAKVTNLENGRSVIVKINDRGPFVKNRLIDLSYAAAIKLGVVKKGTAPVEVATIIPDDATVIANDAQEPPVSNIREKSPFKPVASTNVKPITTKPKLPILPATKAAASTSTVVSTTAKTTGETVNIAASSKENAPSKQVIKTKLKPEKNNVQSAQNIAYFLQIGAFGDKNNAIRLIDRVKAHVDEEFSIDSVGIESGFIHKVKIGPIETIEKADLLIEELEGFELGTPRLIISN